MQQEHRTWNTIFWIAFAVYVVAYFLPTLHFGNEYTPGWWCAGMSIAFLLEPDTTWGLILVGNFANLSVLILLFLRLPIIRPTRALTILSFILIAMAISGTLVWMVILETVRDLFIGYWVWTLSVIALAISHYRYRATLSRWALAQSNAQDCNIADHLVNDKE